LHTPPSKEEKDKLKSGIIIFCVMSASLVLAIVLFLYIPNPEAKPLAMLTMFSIPIVKRRLGKRKY